MKALVQQVNQGHFNHDAFEQSAHGFWERGYEVIRFRWEDLQRGDFDDLLIHEAETTLVRGGVGTVRLALERAGRTPSTVPDLPIDLRPLARRRVWESTLGAFRSEALQRDFHPAIHIKPLDQGKLFKGLVVREFKDLIPTAEHSNDVPILCQEVLSFASEWRAHILRDEILRVCCYRGDPLLFPDPSIMRQAVPLYRDRPIAFSLDWAVTSTGDTVLVEANDGCSLGNYGLPLHWHTAMAEARWRQMMGLRDNFVGERLSPDDDKPW